MYHKNHFRASKLSDSNNWKWEKSSYGSEMVTRGNQQKKNKFEAMFTRFYQTMNDYLWNTSHAAASPLCGETLS